MISHQDPESFFKKVRQLTQALMLSGLVNIGLISFLIYWMMHERPPAPYCELKPATEQQLQLPLANVFNCGAVISRFHQLSYDQLIHQLESTHMVENGYTERDLALSCLVAFHHFDLRRALPGEAQPKQQRLLLWKASTQTDSIPLVIYPGLSDLQFETLIRFARTEKWAMTPKGLFLSLQGQKSKMNIDVSLAEAFMLTPEFTTVEVLFSRIQPPILKQELLELILEGSWSLLNQFVTQQRRVHDLSDARRQKFLLDYVKASSMTAAYLLLKLDKDFAIKKLDDNQVIAVLQLLSQKTQESERFALEMLTSPRSTSVWQQASLRLYEYAGEQIPADWTYQTSLLRFASHKLIAQASPQPKVQPIETAVSTAAPSTSKTPAAVAIAAKPTAKVDTGTKLAPPKEASQKGSPAPAQPAKKPCRLYIVQEGDSLWKISRRFAVDMEVLKEQNQLQSNAIKPGFVLKIP